MWYCFFFFFKQKTAYDMRISDWSSDVCSSDLIEEPFKNGLFAGLSLDHVSVVQAPDPYWEAYSQNGDAQQLGRSWAAMMHAANGPNFAAALAPDRNSEPFLDELSARLDDRTSVVYGKGCPLR